MLERFSHAGLNLSYYDNRRNGPILVFQHGLTGDHTQALSSFRRDDFRLITLECRGHGRSDTGPKEELGIGTFVDDLHALLRQLGVDRAAFAGISMGAATVANFAVRYPAMVDRLVLIRPSWFTSRYPENMAIFGAAADFLSRYGPETGKKLFAESGIHQALAGQSPDNAASLLNIFARKDPKQTVDLLRQILLCDPGFAPQTLADLKIPTLVMGTGQDAVHPLALAKRIADSIPASIFRELFAKSLDKEKHVAELTEAVAAFAAP